MKIAVGSDHAGFPAKQELVKFLSDAEFNVIDCGPYSDKPADYPDYAARVAKAVTSGRCERGLLFCGTGIGMCIAANKIKGIRAALAWNVAVAKLSAQHNWANILCLPSRFTSIEKLKKIVRAWLKTEYEKGGRHERRINKISKFEQKS